MPEQMKQEELNIENVVNISGVELTQKELTRLPRGLASAPTKHFYLFSTIDIPETDDAIYSMSWLVITLMSNLLCSGFCASPT